MYYVLYIHIYIESIRTPGDRVRWSLERLHLCQNPPKLASIGFAFACDAISKDAHQELERTAATLEKHPRLRPDPSAFGALWKDLSMLCAVYWSVLWGFS